MPSVTLSPRADEDVRQIWLYTATTWSERQANIYVDKLFDDMEALAANPALGRRADEIADGLNRRSCGAHVIFYRPSADGVLIVRVLHARMDFVAHLTEEP